MSLSTKLAVIFAGAMWIGVCVGLGIVQASSAPRCYDVLPAGGDAVESHTSPGVCPNYYNPALYALALPGLVALIVGLALPVGPRVPPVPFSAGGW
jgi:hypothetical protein